MRFFETVPSLFYSLLPIVLVVSLVVLGLAVANRVLHRRWVDQADLKFRFQFIMLSLSFISGLIIIVALPISDTLRGQLLSLIGILLSAAIALSSTTFIGNILAGIMLKIIESAKPGDFVTVSDIVGKISEMGLLHTEVQTEDRDLVTIPNIYMVTQPMKVVRVTGTIISAEVSIGYDVARSVVSMHLIEAAESAGLKDAFVQVRELGDYSVVYRVAGLLEEVKSLISARSKLREEMLDTLHQNDIEIVSPGFMNTRTIASGIRFIPEKSYMGSVVLQEATAEDEVLPEDVVFDKANAAASVVQLKKAIETIESDISELGVLDNPEENQDYLNLHSKKNILKQKLSFAEERCLSLDENNNS